MYDIIGDIHGCNSELELLLQKLGYAYEGDNPYKEAYTHPEGRQAVFLGDYCDRGPNSPAVLAIIRRMAKSGTALAIEGNHDNKIMRWLKGNPVKIGRGMRKTVDQMDRAHNHGRPITKDKAYKFLKRLPYKLVLDEGKLLVCHAGLEEKYHLEESQKVHSKCLYGVTTGKKDEDGFPIRLPWQDSYAGERIVVHGHVAVPEPLITNNVYNVDTACVYGGKLTALRYPEMELVSQDALETYWIRGHG
jgi:protein phosphatase